jgi:UDP-N-acetylglucosamine diphosphorylase / glucose-1-phosphate thymidylyltransferase / UDP-N-acetylgalactosamine diphosphorylase / glucosamine-1-phosphate N-acetyltransferase / galactosamine-1-phosphate N-acetyltransferase
MKVLLLAAGRSKRMKPVTDKNFLNFLGKSLLQHQIEQLYKAGFMDLVILGGAHNLETIKDLSKKLTQDAECANLKIKVIEQQNLDDGMAGAVLSAAEEIKEEAIMIMSGNDVVDETAFELIKKKTETEVDGLMLAKTVKDYFPGGYLILNDKHVVGIHEKPGKGNEPSNLVNLVVHYFKNASVLFEQLKQTETTHDDKYEKAIDELIKKGLKIEAAAYEGYWQPVKYPWHVLDLMEFFLVNQNEEKCNESIKNNRENIADSAVIKGKVFLENGVKIMDHATLSGPVYIGKNTIVASNALVRNSIIGANCIVGYSTEIARSFLGNDVWTHTNYIGDSIIGDNCSFGSGTVTGNLRLDEEDISVGINGEKQNSGKNKLGLITGNNIRCGINTSFMPGVKIGSNSMIGANITVSQDIDEGKFVYAKTELIIKDNIAKIDPSKREIMKHQLKKP